MAIRRFSTASIRTGVKFNNFIARFFRGAARALGSFTNSGVNTPFGTWEYFQGVQASGFPSANVMLVVGSYNSNYTTNGQCYTSNGSGGGWTSRTTYPTSIFQTSGIAHDSKFFVLGGSGLNGTAGGGTTANVYYMTTSLNSWTGGTSMPSSGNWEVGRFRDNIVARQGNNYYYGTGTGSWTSMTAPPIAGLPWYLDANKSYVIGDSSVYVTSDNGSTWTNIGVVPPATNPGLIGWTDNNTPTSIYAEYNREAASGNRDIYYFDGVAFTSTNNYQKNRPIGTPGNYTYAIGIVGDKYVAVFGNGSYFYSTIS